LSLVATADPRALNVGLAVRSCHKSVIIKKKQRRKNQHEEKTNEEKEKENLN